MMLLAGLSVWPAAASAQDYETEEELNQKVDPDGIFDFLHFRSYSNTMNVIATVKVDGEEVTDAIVTTYASDGIRSKDVIDTDDGVYYLTIFGDGSVPLVFKVYTGGNIIEVDQGLTFVNDGMVGLDEPYVIDLPAPVTGTLTTEGYGTMCVPFDARIPDGVKAYFTTGIEGTALKLQEITDGVVPKETGVLVKGPGKAEVAWCATVTTPTADASVNKFVGTTAKTSVKANSVLTLGYAKDGDKQGKLGFWRYTGKTIAANRAYVKDFPAGSRGYDFTMEEATGIRPAIVRPVNEDTYDLQGRRVSVLKPGVYIRGGKKYVVR